MTQWPLSDAVEDMLPGLWVRRGAPPPMFSMHRHDDVEINLVLDGQLSYLFGGQPLTIRAGEIAVFWAAQPHGLVDSRAGDMCWLHVPFSMFLSWGLPEAQTAPLFSAQPLITHAPDLAAHIARMADRWGEEVGGAEPGGGAGAATADPGPTVEPWRRREHRDRAARDPGGDAPSAARLLRAHPEAPSDGGGSVPAARLRQVSTMAQYVEPPPLPVTVADIAASVHLPPRTR